LSQVSDRWGVELNGPEADQKAWRMLLKQPFDPFVEEIKDERGDYLALRSSAFDGLTNSEEVHRVAKQLFSTLNVAMSKNADTDPITNGSVIEFVPDGQPRRHHYLEAEGITMRLRVGIPEITVKDAKGNVIEPPLAPSRAQLWMRAAALEPEVGSALRYLEGKPGWFELYKAYEAVRNMPNGGISNSEIKRFTQTANAGERHHPNGKNKPHTHPMELWEARALITKWVSAAIDDILAKNPRKRSGGRAMTDTMLRSDTMVQEAAKQLFVGSAPERANDLADMWLDLEPLFQLTDDVHTDGRIIMDAGAYRYVRFNHRALRAFWIAGYAAWEGYRLVAESPDLRQLDTSRFSALIAAFEQVIERDDPTVAPLPSGVAEPGLYPDGSSDSQDRATAELATIAAAWALLHELRHIRHQREGTGASPFGDDRDAKHREELSCDAFATRFLLDQADNYAIREGVKVESVRLKRQLGIYFGLFAVTLLAKDKWQASDSHPSIQGRLDAVRAIMEPTKTELAAAIAHTAFAVLGQHWPGAPNLYKG
jgi:hypothetical protein